MAVRRTNEVVCKASDRMQEQMVPVVVPVAICTNEFYLAKKHKFVANS